jgi:putative intracellular protease/amidase
MLSAPIATVLVILSAKDFVTTTEGTRHPTGYFLSELAVPAAQLEAAGVELTFATPGGTLPAMDRVSDAASWFGGDTGAQAAARTFVASHLTPDRIVDLEALDATALAGFDGVLVPGGHAPLEDLATDPGVARALAHFHAEDKATGLICHGPAALLATAPFLYAGYRMTAFSTAEERQEEDAGHLDGHMPYYLDAALAARGAIVQTGEPWAAEAVRDRELVTGRNPFSDHAFADLYLEALAERILRRAPTAPLGASLELGARTVVIAPPAELPAAAYSSIWIGAARGADFEGRISRHVALTAATFAPRGLIGYEVLATPDLEIAILTWTDAAAADRAFATPEGQAVAADAGTFMDKVIFKARYQP